MAGLKEIRRRIGSVKSTMQITRAMKLVSAAKLRRAQDLVISGRTFSSRLGRIVRSIILDLKGKDFHHPAFEGRKELKRRLVIVISSDRGLCGAYNTNLLKAIQVEQVEKELEIEKEFMVIGRKGLAFAKRHNWKIFQQFEGLPENPVQWPINDIRKTIIEDFVNEKYDEIVIYYTRFISGMNQSVETETLLPISALPEIPDEEVVLEEDRAIKTFPQIQYSPEPRQIMRELVPAMINMQLRQAAYEAKASEHAARMTAMDSATHNASELIDKLKLFYNRARQSTITRELIDIVGGAEAIK